MSEDPSFDPGPGVRSLATRLAHLQSDRGDLIIGVTGSVASGKSTLARQLVDLLSADHSVETVSTDGFLFPNRILSERGLTLRKGFPETYDRAAMAEAITSLREATASFPVHSHITYDIEPSLTRHITRPAFFFLEGLGFEPAEPPRGPHQPDLLVYLDAALADLEAWFLGRFLRFWHAAEHDPKSFYAQFRHMTEPELMEFARSVWTEINLPNLTNHIAPLKDAADIVVRKDADHAIKITDDRTR